MEPTVYGFNLAEQLYGDPAMAEIFDADTTIGCWLAVEAALASAQADLGVIEPRAAEAIAEVCEADKIDRQALWESARNVGYPILGLVRQIDAALEEPLRGSVHFGATTQDIMDSGLALQLKRAGTVLTGHVDVLGDALADLVERHGATVLPGRTHGQQAVPTTFGAKLAVFLDEFTRHRVRLAAATAAAARVSLHGAGGTGAAFGESAARLRALVADRLELADAPVPWHVSRDSLAHLAAAAAAAATGCARLAREVIDLSRTEIGEVTERVGHHRGASSTMPQKSNPITSEAVIGFAVAASSQVGGMYRAMEAGHERAAGEWQVEWVLLPAVLRSAASAVRLTGELVAELNVRPDRMRANLEADNGLIMAEATMVRLAPSLGRERAHDVVYELSLTARRTGTPLASVVRRWLADNPIHGDGVGPDAADYLGQAPQICIEAIQRWTAVRRDVEPGDT